MKCILVILLLAALALWAGLLLAAGGLLVVAIVLLVGDLVAMLPESPCTQNCRQGDNCTCPLADRRRQP
jgi:hypothetical protein